MQVKRAQKETWTQLPSVFGVSAAGGTNQIPTAHSPPAGQSGESSSHAKWDAGDRIPGNVLVLRVN